MKKLVIVIVLICFLVASIALVGCGDKKEGTSSVKKSPEKKTFTVKKGSGKSVSGAKKKKVGGMKKK